MRVSFRRLLWPSAIFLTASTGLFLGSIGPAHSDISKYAQLFAEYEHANGQVVVKLSSDGARMSRVQSVQSVLPLQNTHLLGVKAFETNSNFYTIQFASDEDAENFLSAAENNSAIAYAEPNYIYHAQSVPNDPDFSQQWGLHNGGQSDADGTIGLAGADVHAPEAWGLSTGSSKVIVAVIDTGIDYNHPDLQGNIYQNPAESGAGKENNGIDDDGNGFIDDFHGWNFAGVSNNDPMDDNVHGTHVAGTIGAKGNNGAGIAGINWNISLLPIKFLDAGGSGTLDNAVKAIQYATLMHVNVINNSWSGGAFSEALLDAITAAQQKGILFVAASGNDGTNNDTSPHYPASYQSDNVISVAASTNQDTLADYATYGLHTVNIAAPGTNIFSTVTNGAYDVASGSSEAAAFVSGAAALLWSVNPGLSYAAIKDRLLRSRDFVPELSRYVSSGGRLNIYNALAGIYDPSGVPVESDWQDVAIAPVQSAHPYADNSNLTWTIPVPVDAKYVRVHFAQMDIEAPYDQLQILQADGAVVDTLNGTQQNFYSYFTRGQTLTLHFTSDVGDDRYGFLVDKIQVVRK